MDKYPVFEGKKAAGEMTVYPEALYTVFAVSCPWREGLWTAWAVGETGSLRIGVPEPEGGCLRIRRRFSQRADGAPWDAPQRRTAAAGAGAGAVGAPAAGSRKCPYLRRTLGQACPAF